MGNNQSTAMRAQLAQAQRRIETLQAEKKVIETKQQAERANPSPFVVKAVRFLQSGVQFETPQPVSLTISYMGDQLSQPLELISEASKRGVTLTESHVDRSTPSGKVIYHVYSGLTDLNAKVAARPGYGTRQNDFYKKQTFVTKYNGGTPSHMTKDDVHWILNHLQTTTQQSRSIGAQLQERMAQLTGRSGVHQSYIESSHNDNVYSIQANIPRPPAGQSTIQYRQPSLYPPDQIHFQQVSNR